MTTSWCNRCRQKTMDREQEFLCSGCFLPKGKTKLCMQCGNCKVCGQFKDAETLGFDLDAVVFVTSAQYTTPAIR